MMPDPTPSLSAAYDARLAAEDADARETAQRAQQLSEEMFGVLLSGNGAVRHLDSRGHQQTMSAAEAFECYAMPNEVLAILREAEKAVGVPNTLRIKIGGLFEQIANDFAAIAAENSR